MAAAAIKVGAATLILGEIAAVAVTGVQETAKEVNLDFKIY